VLGKNRRGGKPKGRGGHIVDFSKTKLKKSECF